MQKWCFPAQIANNRAGICHLTPNLCPPAPFSAHEGSPPDSRKITSEGHQFPTKRRIHAQFPDKSGEYQLHGKWKDHLCQQKVRATELTKPWEISLSLAYFTSSFAPTQQLFLLFLFIWYNRHIVEIIEDRYEEYYPEELARQEKPTSSTSWAFPHGFYPFLLPPQYSHRPSILAIPFCRHHSDPPLAYLHPVHTKPCPNPQLGSAILLTSRSSLATVRRCL
jgi:hypothetical protein